MVIIVKLILSRFARRAKLILSKTLRGDEFGEDAGRLTVSAENRVLESRRSASAATLKFRRTGLEDVAVAIERDL
jgi:hypothetical protein